MACCQKGWYQTNNNTSTIEREKVVELHTASGIRVTYSSPENIPETIRRQKLNRMYDILSSADRRNDDQSKSE